jgi:hypothetical protein
MKQIKKLLRPGWRLLKHAAMLARRPALLRKIPALADIDPAKPLYVFFAPDAAVVTHFVSHAIVARTLREQGHQVLLVHCEANYPHCLVMDMRGLGINKSASEKAEICRSCDSVWLHTAASYGLPSISISDLVDADTRRRIHDQVAAMPADAGKFEVEGFRFGALCGSDLALSRKALNQMHVTGENRRILEAYVEGALLAYRAAQRLMQNYTVARLLYFNEYSMVLGAAVAAIKEGVPVTRLCQAVFRSIDRSKIALTAEPLAIYTYHRLLDEWPAWRNLALPPGLVDSVADHALLRLAGEGHTIYSPRHGGSTEALYQKLGLSPDRRLVVAYSSSMDEYYSNVNLMDALGKQLFSKEQPFADQMSWLRELIAHVEASTDLQLVVRLHPREGRNAHEQMESDNLRNLQREFSAPHRHVRVIWPEENISSYDLAEIADVALPAWSNISLELARMGIPTLIAFQRYVPFPMGDVVHWAPTPEGYFRKIRELAIAPVSLDQVRFAYRWTNIYNLSLVLDFDDLIPSPTYPGLPPFQIPRVAAQVEDILVRGASVTEINRQALASKQGPKEDEAETAALRRALRRLFWLFGTGKLRDDDYVLVMGPERGQADLAIELDDDRATLRFADRIVTRKSRILQRMAGLAASEIARQAQPVPA